MRILCALSLLALLGCGSGLESPVPLVPVTGAVTYNGQPLQKGSITFMPAGEGDNTATGQIENGQYSLSTFQEGDGAPPGQYKVAITAWEKMPGMGTEGVPAIPKKYFNADESGLTATIGEDQSEPIDFALTGE